jgi:capsid protein
MEVDAGFRSRASVIAARGDDPDLVDDERLADQEREDDLGIRSAGVPVAEAQDETQQEEGGAEEKPNPTAQAELLIHTRILDMLDRGVNGARE